MSAMIKLLKNLPFQTIGGGAYFAAQFLQLPSNFTETDFERKTRELCAMNLTEVGRPLVVHWFLTLFSLTTATVSRDGVASIVFITWYANGAI